MKRLLYVLPVLLLISLFAWHTYSARADVYGASLVGWWTLDNGRNGTGSGNITDSSGTGNNGTSANSPTVAAGTFAQALTFNGVNQDINLGNDSSLSPQAITMSAWVNYTSFPTSYMSLITANDVSNNYHAMLVRNDGKLAWYIAASGGNVQYDGTGSHTMVPGKWYHLVLVYSSSVGLIGYVNGEFDNSAAANGTLKALGGDGTTLIANDPNNAFRLTAGTIDDARIYNRALSAQEVQTLYYFGISQHRQGNY